MAVPETPVDSAFENPSRISVPGRRDLILFFILGLLFLGANRSAYKGYFQDDDLDTMGWAPFVSSSEFLLDLVSPRVMPNNFRPVGHYYYHMMITLFHLDFPKYVLPLQFIFLLNMWLLWLIGRKLELSAEAALVGVIFYSFHPALLDAHWKVMYIFDLLCTTFCLLALLLWMQGRWLLSFVSFWLAYKSKELAIALPALLLAYEIIFDKKRWRRLIPFFVVSLSFGVQSLLNNAHRDNDYTLRFDLPSLLQTGYFYSSNLFLLPLAGLILIPLPFFVRDKRLWFGLASALMFLGPLLFLPGRLFAVYWCLPLTGIALVIMTSAHYHKVLIVICLIAWAPWVYLQLRQARALNLWLERGNHAFVMGLVKAAKLDPNERTFVYDGVPEAFHPWGVTGAVSCAYGTVGQKIYYIDDPGAKELVRTHRALFLHWERSTRQLQVTPR